MEEAKVVAFIIPKNGKVLAEKRKEERKIDPGKIVLPGGHVEKKESREQACRRELKEELDIDCDDFEFVIEKIHETEIEKQLVNYYLCKNWDGPIECNEAETVFWIKQEDKDVLDYEIDREALEKFWNE